MGRNLLLDLTELPGWLPTWPGVEEVDLNQDKDTRRPLMTRRDLLAEEQPRLLLLVRLGLGVGADHPPHELLLHQLQGGGVRV